MSYLKNKNELFFIKFYLIFLFGRCNGRDWNAYREYTQEIVMKKFYDVFLKKYLEPESSM